MIVTEEIEIQLFDSALSNSTGKHGCRCQTPLWSVSVLSKQILKTIYLIISSDRFPILVKSAVKSNNCLMRPNLSNHALNALTVIAFTTKLGNLYQIFTTCAEKNVFVKYNETYC